MICIEILKTCERRRIEQEVWCLRQRNGTVVRCPRQKAQGVGDGELLWSLGTLEGYPEAKIITLAEFEETLGEIETDPELSAEEALYIMMGGSYETE